MKTIEILTNFRHHGAAFYAGERRIVEDTDAGYFCGVGWAKAADLETGSAPLHVTLDVQDGQHNTTGENIRG